MGKPTGFKEIPRQLPHRRPVELRLLDWNEVYADFPKQQLRDQGARCMDCGIPFCHNGCPLGNIIPEWNDLVYKDRWLDALDMLYKTNNFPEFTGRVCPAPCEEACVLNINEKPVTIKLIEQSIIDHAFARADEGDADFKRAVGPQVPEKRTGKRVAVVGSGPSGLAAAAQLNKAGHLATVFERADRIGGLLTYGIPNFKLEKHVVDRRIKVMEAEGITFKTNANIGFDVTVEDLRRDFDAIVLCGGATQARELNVPGRELKGVYPAMTYLPMANKRCLGDECPPDFIDAKGKHVVILGGGDTGADCLGTAQRQGAKSIKQFELLPRPPESRSEDAVRAGNLQPWPYWPMIFRTSSAHEEAAKVFGADVRDFSINTKKFTGDEQGNVRKLHGVRLEWAKDASGRFQMTEVPGSEFEIDCDLCLLAMGFVSPEHPGPIQQLGLALDPRGNVKVDDNYMSSVPGVFAAGDMRRGQSLVVWAISEGRQAARGVDQFLMGRTELPYLKLF
jgi:glutamate synthase (NADPH/NADH) small chain